MDFSDIQALIKQYAIPTNEFAAVKNGASVTYTPTAYSAEDDLGILQKQSRKTKWWRLGAG